MPLTGGHLSFMPPMGAILLALCAFLGAIFFFVRAYLAYQARLSEEREDLEEHLDTPANRRTTGRRPQATIPARERKGKGEKKTKRRKAQDERAMLSHEDGEDMYI